MFRSAPLFLFSEHLSTFLFSLACGLDERDDGDPLRDPLFFLFSPLLFSEESFGGKEESGRGEQQRMEQLNVLIPSYCTSIIYYSCRSFGLRWLLLSVSRSSSVLPFFLLLPFLSLFFFSSVFLSLNELFVVPLSLSLSLVYN